MAANRGGGARKRRPVPRLDKHGEIRGRPRRGGGPLHWWLEREDVPNLVFAARLSEWAGSHVSPARVSSWQHRRTPIGPYQAVIERLTGGQVTREDWQIWSEGGWLPPEKRGPDYGL